MVSTALASLAGLSPTTPADPAAPLTPNPLPALAYAAYRATQTAPNPSPAAATIPTGQPPVDPPATVGTPNPTTGVVTGSLNFTGDNLTYTVTTEPTNGTVTVNTAGDFTYTPTARARAAAAVQGAPTSATQDNFIVTASNSAGSAPETVTVPVSPTDPPTADTAVTRAAVVAAVTTTDPPADAPAAPAINGVPVAVVVGALAVVALATVVAPAIAILATGVVFDAAVVGAGAVGLADVAAIGVNAGFALLPPTVLNLLGGTTAATLLGLTTEAGVVAGFLGDTTGILAAIRAIADIITEAGEGSGEGTGTGTTGTGSPGGISSLVPCTGTATCTVTPAGVVSGTVSFANGTNTYSVTSGPSEGTVVVNSATGAFTYVPTEAAQLTATGLSTDMFTETATKTGAPPSSDTITVPISGATLAVTKTINVGALPIGVAVSPNGNDVYVTNTNASTGTGQVSVIDTNPADATTYNTVVNTIGVGNDPVGVAVSNTGADVYVTNDDDGTVSVINTATNSVVTSFPVGNGNSDTSPNNGDPATNPDFPLGVATGSTGKAYLANRGNDSVTAIDTTQNAVDGTIASFPGLPAGVGPFGVAVSPNGQQVYVTITGEGPNGNTQGKVEVINTATNGVTSIPVGFNPYGVAVSPTGNLAYVANGSSTAVSPNGNTGTVSVIDTNPADATYDTVVDTINVGGIPEGVAFSPDGTLAYVTETSASLTANGTTVAVINTATNTIITTVTVGTDPIGVAVAPNGTAYVTNNAGATGSTVGTVSVISLIQTG